jgi:hypothetical protein
MFIIPIDLTVSLFWAVVCAYDEGFGREQLDRARLGVATAADRVYSRHCF